MRAGYTFTWKYLKTHWHFLCSRLTQEKVLISWSDPFEPTVYAGNLFLNQSGFIIEHTFCTTFILSYYHTEQNMLLILKTLKVAITPSPVVGLLATSRKLLSLYARTCQVITAWIDLQSRVSKLNLAATTQTRVYPKVEFQSKEFVWVIFISRILMQYLFLLFLCYSFLLVSCYPPLCPSSFMFRGSEKPRWTILFGRQPLICCHRALFLKEISPWGVWEAS